MKKSNIQYYDKTNLKKSPLYKKYKRKRRKEKFSRFIALPTVLWIIAFFTASVLFLLLSYIVNESNPWLSGVWVSVASGIITGVILYFLANLRNSILQTLDIESDEIQNIYNLTINVLSEGHAVDPSRAEGMRQYWTLKCERMIDKLDELQAAFNGWNAYLFEKKDGLESLSKTVFDLEDRYYYLVHDEDRRKWLSDIVDRLTPTIGKLEIVLDKQYDQIGFIRKYIF